MLFDCKFTKISIQLSFYIHEINDTFLYLIWSNTYNLPVNLSKTLELFYNNV